MAVIESRCRKDEFTGLDHRLAWFAHGRVIHTVMFIHGQIPWSRFLPNGMAPVSLKLATLADFW